MAQNLAKTLLTKKPKCKQIEYESNGMLNRMFKGGLKIKDADVNIENKNLVHFKLFLTNDYKLISILPERMSDRIIKDSDLADIWGLPDTWFQLLTDTCVGSQIDRQAKSTPLYMRIQSKDNL
ncbi:hypothetical protein FF38_07503 [Lucilia cuprina]|uniref:Uncharacterized protein n=1 Tax=Lucilia cuprina TaxID=7375 RepID=A0A0L0CLW2_LUCCU|nr:hypothetical protein FF38_07503 [Lucilia cuprina]